MQMPAFFIAHLHNVELIFSAFEIAAHYAAPFAAEKIAVGNHLGRMNARRAFRLIISIISENQVSQDVLPANKNAPR